MAGSVAKGRDAVFELLLNLTIYLANRRLHVGRTTCSSSFTPIKMANFSETFLAANYIMQFSRNSSSCMMFVLIHYLICTSQKYPCSFNIVRFFNIIRIHRNVKSNILVINSVSNSFRSDSCTTFDNCERFRFFF